MNVRIVSLLPLEVLATVLLLPSCGPSPKRTSQWSEGELQLVESTLGLHCPCALAEIGTYEDGGSIGGELRDEKGAVLEFAWDGRIRPGADPTPRLLHLGANYPDGPGARAVPVGSPEEAAFVVVLRYYADEQIPRAGQDSLTALYFDYSRPARAGLTPLTKLPQGQARAIQALHLVGILEKQMSHPESTFK